MRLFGRDAEEGGTVQPASRAGMVKQVKGGYLLRYKKRLFGKPWREEWVVLYEDSTLAWYKEKGRLEPEGSLVVKEAPEMMAVSQWTLRIPGRPDLPSGCGVVQLMAFGNRRRDKVHWLLAQSEEEVNDWMTAIGNTLPPPPQPPKPPDDKTARPLDPVTPRLPPVSYYSPIPGEVPPAYNPQMPPPAGGGGGGVGSGGGPPPVGVPYQPYTRSAPQPMPLSVQPLQQQHAPPANNTTIVVRDRDNGAADFTTGVVMGAALSNWGHGWGWGGGWGHCHYGGYGFGYGGGGGGGGYYHNDQDVTINNHYDINNTVISNDVTHTDISYVNEDYGDIGLDDGDYGMDCGGDFGF
ncbi:hypothetical protein R5R35_012793 [Gryllus longicercus]|uniref:PH domain-containing protein n=1 Tax=Gryllus longicercus TaxID=2509291 RepID=A0AAN9VI76_9ORTH